MSYDMLRIDRLGDGVATLWLDRPAKRNAMSVGFFRDLPRALAELDEDPEVAVCVLTGEGEAFSAGGDIASFGELHEVSAYRRRLRLVYDAFHSVERAEVPVIGAINGIAFGGGTELTLACDLAIASERARFAFREPQVGLMPGYGIVRGPHVIGPAWTRWLALTADAVDAQQALQMGLVQRVVSHDRLLDDASDVARRIAANAPLGVRLAKQFINRSYSAPGLVESIEATALLFTSADHKEAVDAFVNKRPPRFSGA